MKSGRFIAALLTAAAGFAAEPVRAPLAFAQITLHDGRKLEQVVVHTYDEQTDSALVMAKGVLRSVSLREVPEDLARVLRDSAPRSNSSVSYVADPRSMELASAEDFIAEPELAQAHQAAARDRVERFFRFEFEPGRSTSALQAIEVETGQPRPVRGSPGQFRIDGTAYVEFYDFWARTFVRTTRHFSVLTEERANGGVNVAGFSRR